MLRNYLQRFETEPVGALLPSSGGGQQSALIDLGAMHPAKRAVRWTCKACRFVDTRQVYSYSDHALRCNVCGADVDVWPAFQAAQVRHEWLPKVLSEAMAGEGARETELLPYRLWRLAMLPTASGSVPIYLLRCGWHVDYEPVVRALVEEDAESQMVLTTSKVLTRDIGDSSRMVVPLIQVAKLEPQGLLLDLDRLGGLVVPAISVRMRPRDDNLWFEVSADGSRLRMNGQDLFLYRKQRDFILALAEAHASGHRRPKLEWVLRRAKYKGQVTSPRQICARDDFARFIEWNNGEVAVRDEVIPKNTANPSQVQSSRRRSARSDRATVKSRHPIDS